MNSGIGLLGILYIDCFAQTLNEGASEGVETEHIDRVLFVLMVVHDKVSGVNGHAEVRHERHLFGEHTMAQVLGRFK